MRYNLIAHLEMRQDWRLLSVCYKRQNHAHFYSANVVADLCRRTSLEDRFRGGSEVSEVIAVIAGTISPETDRLAVDVIDTDRSHFIIPKLALGSCKTAIIHRRIFAST